MTKEQFISNLPKTINHFSYGSCSLTILEDNKYRKIACYMNKDKWIAGYRIGRDFEKLFKEVMEWLRKEGY